MCMQLTLEERDRLAQLRHDGFNQQEIAGRLKRSPSTISRELRRNATATRGGRVYDAAQAQREAQRRRRERPLTRKLDDPRINEGVRRGLAREWSPAQISGRLKLEDSAVSVSPQTIYTWIKRHANREHWESLLRRRGKRPSRRKPASRPDAARIKNRPPCIERRERLGDFEGDTVQGKPGTGGLVSLTDRQSRYTLLIKIHCKRAAYVRRRIQQRLQKLDSERRRSMTFDNGSEFAECDRLAQRLQMALYYADPGCPFQRGSNENTNGLTRFYFPKGTDFRTVSPHEARQVQDTLNHRPRACLGFRTPYEVFHGQSLPRDCI